MYSKLRGSIAGVYAWRAQHAADDTEKQRMNEEADFAFRQAWALCPESSDAAYRYSNLLTSEKRLSDALSIAETTSKMPGMEDSDRSQVRELVGQLKRQAR
jgi:hypothetical protein